MIQSSFVGTNYVRLSPNFPKQIKIKIFTYENYF